MIRKYLGQFKASISHWIRWSICTMKIDWRIANCHEPGIAEQKYCDADVVVSLTTHGKRLQTVYLAIESIMQQTTKPNRILLWLSDELRGMPLPQPLQAQVKRGLEVKYCTDMRSYTKLLPTLKSCPESVIITIDDDVIYDKQMIEWMIRDYQKDSSLIYFNRGHRITLKNGMPNKYTEWDFVISDYDISPLNFPTGMGGVLYPINCFLPEVFNDKDFMNICPLGDDIWFKAMALYSGVSCRKVSNPMGMGNYLINEKMQDIGLLHQNLDNGKNDEQLTAVFKAYSLYDKLILK